MDRISDTPHAAMSITEARCTRSHRSEGADSVTLAVHLLELGCVIQLQTITLDDLTTFTAWVNVGPSLF